MNGFSSLLRDMYLSDFFENRDSVIEIGSKDIWDNLHNIKQLVGQIKKNFELDDVLSCMENGRLSNRYLWQKFGIQKYECIDLDGAHDCHMFDLNKNLDTTYGFKVQYDIVTNFGTSEHVFDQNALFSNIHNLCKHGGIIIHSLPINGYKGHSLYIYQVDFFYLLAKANDYNILAIWLLDGENYYEYSDNKYKKLCDTNSDIAIGVVFEKKHTKPFVAPQQEAVYRSDSKSHFLKEKEVLVFDFFKKYLNLNGLNDLDGFKCAIFGAGNAGLLALKFCKQCNIQVLCVIDDYKSGLINDIKIVSRSEFEEFFEKNVNFILKGPFQQGSLGSNKLFIELPVILV